MAGGWPTMLWLLRHGQSAGNVARDAAEAGGLARIDIATRDMDVPLSPLGEQQAQAVGDWFTDREHDRRPTVIITSPYERARQTALIVAEAAGTGAQRIEIEVDERLREREFGAFDRLTRAGITELFPEQAEFRRFLGKFYHRPPGGENWCDVGLRVRSLLASLKVEYPGERVLLVTHEVVVKMSRYVLEGLDEAAVLALDRDEELANGSITAYELDPSAHPRRPFALRAYNLVAPLVEEGAPVTSEADEPVGRG
jgi:2,3-bisphosphoglycerate-dependent phosphoglycerate mutase